MSNGSSSDSATERRAAARTPFEAEAVFYVGTEIWKAPCQNICPHGLGILLDRPPDPKTPIVVELRNRVENYWHRKHLRVVHATPRGDNTWIVGSMFVQELSDDELRALLLHR
jgi:hypothetical protein